jgi:hypothetical protein
MDIYAVDAVDAVMMAVCRPPTNMLHCSTDVISLALSLFGTFPF